MALLPHALKQAEYERTLWQVVLPKNTTIEEVLVPEFWSHVAKQFHPHDKITIWAYDGSWVCEAYILYSDNLSARVVPQANGLTVFNKVPAKEQFEVDNKHLIAYVNPSLRWTVQRKKKGKDNEMEIIKDGLQSKDHARAWLKDHLTAVGA